jgi:DNA-directed RNA polymerase specialized sigma24 family protein
VKDVDVSHDAARVEVERLYRVEGARLWRAVFAWSGDSAVADDAVAERSARLTSIIGPGASRLQPKG